MTITAKLAQEKTYYNKNKTKSQIQIENFIKNIDTHILDSIEYGSYECSFHFSEVCDKDIISKIEQHYEDHGYNIFTNNQGIYPSMKIKWIRDMETE